MSEVSGSDSLPRAAGLVAFSTPAICAVWAMAIRRASRYLMCALFRESSFVVRTKALDQKSFSLTCASSRIRTSSPSPM
ncbi:hypothetical protein ACIREO_39425 [Streptomyces sp. NPDC102441]|uniref:hypothetical protein n=1 Tax=Streptomyces sp. NPDC102441 TaxID=3366176 RepID=UPI003812B513